MAMEELSLGPTPAEEDCEQLGPNYDPIKAREECKRYIALLNDLFPPPPGCRFRITSNPHDFGTYLDVVASYPEDSEEGADWAYDVEDNAPMTWPEEDK